jgi:hypothetical protein
MDSENNYDVVPINNSCNDVINKDVTISSPGSKTAHSDQNITNINNQYDTNSQYDSIDNVKPLYGGILKNNMNTLFTIKFRNKVVNIESLNEKKAIKIFLNNKIYKKDHLLEIIHKNKNTHISSFYIIKNGYKNKFKKMVVQ